MNVFGVYKIHGYKMCKNPIKELKWITENQSLLKEKTQKREKGQTTDGQIENK